MNLRTQCADETLATPPRHGLRWMLAGFGLGGISASAYLFLGGEYFLGVPLWARTVFFPGFVAGYQAHEMGMTNTLSEVVGVLAVALAYAALAASAWIVWHVLRGRRHTAAGAGRHAE